MKKTLLFILTFFFASQVKAQLNVFSTIPTGTILQNNFSGNGVQINNVTYTGSNTGGGVFNSSNTNLGLSSGIILTTGNASGAVGPNLSGNFGTNQGGAGDSDLEQILGGSITTYDAAVLEFDVVSSTDSIFLKLVYASEGYSESIGLNQADPIGVFISGPGFPTPTNLALLPNSTDPISINSINSITNSNLFVDNSNGTNIQYDGFTKPLQIATQVMACAVYHIKIVIADAGDPNGDSGLFLETGSLQSGVTNPIVCQMGLEWASNNETCAGNCDGFINVFQVLGGFPPYSFNWSNNETTQSISNLCPGNYNLIITDDVGNKDTFFYSIFDATPIQVSSINQNLICTGDTFSVNLSISGGTPPYTISFPDVQPIDTIDSETFSFIATLDQDYQFYIQDANNCGIFHNATITVEDYGHLSGQVFLNNDLNYLSSSQTVEVTLLKKTTTNMVWEVKEVQYIDDQNTNKSFSFGSIQSGVYVILAKVLPDNLGGAVLPTYSGDKYLWSQAIPDTFGTNCSLKNLDIHLVNNIDSVQGSGSIEGNIYLSDFFGKTESSTDPIPLIDIVVEKDSTPSISTDNQTSFFPWNSTFAIEQTPGSQIFPYKLPQMPNGIYKVKVQIPGIPMIANYPTTFTTLTLQNDSIVDINFCADSFLLGRIDTCISNATVGITEKQRQAFEIYPNPSHGPITIKLESIQQKGTFTLYSLLGEKVVELPLIGQNQIDLSFLQLQGIYLAEIESNGKSHKTKIIFQPRNL